MVLPHSKSGNEPLESTLPPTRYFMVVMEWVEHSLNDYKSLVLPLNYITILVRDMGLEPILYPWKGYVLNLFDQSLIVHILYHISMLLSSTFYNYFGVLERIWTFK